MSIQAQVLLAARATQSSAADNATATATAEAIPGMTQRVLGVSADYSATVSSIKTVTVTGKDTVIYRWDFTNGPFHLALPLPVVGVLGATITVALEASGSGGVTGRATAYHFAN